MRRQPRAGDPASRTRAGPRTLRRSPIVTDPCSMAVLTCHGRRHATCPAAQVRGSRDLQSAARSAHQRAALPAARARRRAELAADRGRGQCAPCDAVLPEPRLPGSRRTPGSPREFSADLDRGDAASALIDADDPKIAPFLTRGGKHLLIGGGTTTCRREATSSTRAGRHAVGPALARDGVRLFMVPGMHHCLGEKFATNPTTDFDAVSVLKEWKATGRVPDQIVVTQTSSGWNGPQADGLAYPQVAQYRGTGDTAIRPATSAGSRSLGPQADGRTSG